MKRFLFIPLTILLILTGCKQSSIFESSPAMRTQAQITHLDSLLKSAPHGWKMVYFPKVDSLLFINSSETLKSSAVQKNYYGYGGFQYLVKFNDRNQLTIVSDNGGREQIQKEIGEYAIRLHSSIQLSFTTYTSIHRLVNNEFEGVSDFLFRYKDFKGRLVFSTAKEHDSSRSYIMLTPIGTESEWSNGMETARQNRVFFEQMKNPQIRIQKGGRLFFQSDVPLTASDYDNSLTTTRRHKRYHLFLFLLQEYGGVIQKGYNAIGSGYVATESGLSFRPGFFYDKNVIFHDFERVGDTFVAQLVRVYNPLTRRFQYESKHLFPDGEDTNFTAEIYDAK